MRIVWAEIRDFRNHAETRVEPPPGLAVAVGGNGEGKTNLLEGLYYLLTLSSPRVSSDLPLVRAGATSAYVRGEIDTESGRPLIEVEVRGSGANRIHVNRSVTRRRTDVRRLVRAVFFGPGDLAIIQGDPEERRAFMDEAVAGLWPLREAARRAYDRALRQRNRLLKEWDGSGEPLGLGVWDEELVVAGSALTRLRSEAIGRLAPHASEEFLALAGYDLVVAYAPSVEGEAIENAFRARLAERRRDELTRRTSLVGPHRDELTLEVRDLGARGFASHGEAWAAALCLRLALAAAVRDEAGDAPVLLLDDPFSGLDPARQRALQARMEGRGQTIVSVPDEAQIPEGADVVWRVASGRLAESDREERAN